MLNFLRIRIEGKDTQKGKVTNMKMILRINRSVEPYFYTYQQSRYIDSTVFDKSESWSGDFRPDRGAQMCSLNGFIYSKLSFRDCSDRTMKV